ncbi:MAG: hypothetical protein MJ249_09860, partial [Kiritimatiellae bacterium]|nr:hypothetical protein [Kiritimatiellia bacterium]
VYMSCPVLGRGTLRATWTPEEGNDLSDETSYQVIEPIRELVNTERFNGTGPIMNPSRLVYGTNAILKVSVKLAAGDTFALTNEVFRRVSGPGRIVSQWRMGNDWYARVAATAVNGEFEVEARFSDEESQPCFWLPVVQERVLHVRAFVVENGGESSLFNWDEDLIRDQFDEVNDIYSQVGVRFSLDEVRTSQVGTCDDWTIDALETYVDGNGRMSARYTEQIHRLLGVYESNDCIRVFFTGKIMVFGTQYGAFTIKQTEPLQAIFMSTATNVRSLAHELGHALGLEGCLPIPRERPPDHSDGGGSSLVLRDLFPDGRDDWGTESGRGYYETSGSVENLIERLLMFERTSSTKSDLPDRRILSGLPRIKNGQRKGPVKAGAFYIIPNDERIYKHEN